MDPHEMIIDYFDKLYPHAEYASKISLIKEHFLKSLNCDMQGNKIRVLDLCTGTGRALSLFDNNKDFELFGIDISSRLIAKAKENYKGVKFFEGDILKLADTFCNGKFNLILLCGMSLQLFSPQERRNIFSQVTKILSNTGFFYFDIYTKVLEEETCYTKYGPKEDKNVEVCYRRVPSQPPEPWTQHVILKRKKIGYESWDRQTAKVSIYNVTVDEIIREMNSTGLKLTDFQFEKSDNSFFRMAMRDVES